MDIIPNHCSSISKRIYSKSNTGRNILFLLSSFFTFMSDCLSGFDTIPIPDKTLDLNETVKLWVARLLV